MAILSLALGSAGLSAAVPPLAEFGPLDARVRALGKPDSPADLAQRIARIAGTDWEKVRAVYVWLAENLVYDVEGFFGRRNMVANAATAFNTRRAVCQGYAELFSELAGRLGLECETISGYAKGYSFRAGQTISSTNHAWNLALVDGEWRLFDATWAAGSLDGSKFVKRYSDAWFASDPRLFVLQHLPEDPAKELLPVPVSLATYQKLPYYEAWRLILMTEAGLDADQQLALLSGAGKEFILGLGSLAKAGFSPAEMVELSAVAGLPASFGYRAAAMARLGAGNAEIIALARSGRLPMAYELPALGLKHSRLPWTLDAGVQNHFELAGDNLADAALINAGTWLYFQAADGLFTLDKALAAGKAMLVVKIKGQGRSYTGLVEYMVK
jgi:hypothetical protein